MNARLSEDGYDGLAAFCRSHGITMTAYLDALGQWLARWQAGEEPTNVSAARITVQIVEKAREIDGARRSRG